DAFSESSSIVSGLGLEDMHHAVGQNTRRNSDSSLSEETILEHLQVITPKAKFGGENKGHKEEVDTCAICYGEYEENKKIGKLQFGHLFHVDCIKSWLSPILNHFDSYYYPHQPQTTFGFVDEVAILNHFDSYYYPHQPQTTIGFVDEVAVLNHVDLYYDEVVILNHILPYYYPRQPQNHMFPTSPHSHIMHDILMNNSGDAFSESSFIVSGLGLEDMHHALEQNTNTNSGLGLSEETILEHLQVITPKAKFGGENKGQKEEVDTCAICYDVTTPLSTEPLSSINSSPSVDATPYRRLVGSLQYLAFTHPDIYFLRHKQAFLIHA
nr:hypothetical protein [Tanacetum cinerariifolium]